MTAVPQKAPDFTLLDENGATRSLSEFKGKKVVLYFYPKDDTPGCTKEACSFRDSHTEYAKHNIVVLGVSYDTPESHLKFKQKYNLPFILLSDTNREVAKLYGAYTNITHFLFPKRITFLINEDGFIIKTLENIDVAQHAQQVLQEFGIKE